MNKNSRADMHVHSTASELSKLGVQRSLRIPECATPPEEVYELAKRRGMDFVTITDHDTIAGALALDHLADTFISEELTAWFKGEPQAVHVLCYGITPDDHDWLQAHREDVEACADYIHSAGITAALAHPFYAVEAPLTPVHRRRLAELFPIWETRNGSRAKELNLPAFVYIETHGGTAIGGSDDHAGVDIGRTFTETPPASCPEEFLAHIRSGRAESRGVQGSAAKWTHAAIALAVRSMPLGDGHRRPDPGRVLKIVERLMGEGDRRRGRARRDLAPEDAVALVVSWLSAMDLGADPQGLIELLQEPEFNHADLYRRACRSHERRLAAAVNRAVGGVAPAGGGAQPAGSILEQPAGDGLPGLAAEVFDACVAAIPYAAATAFLGREKIKLSRSEGDRPRVALIAEGLGSMHGVTQTVQQIRERGVPGFDVEIIGTDPEVDRRLAAVAEIGVPFYPGLKVGVPSLPAVVDAVAEGRYDLIHLATPGPTGAAAWLLARVLDLPLAGSYHTELARYARLRSGQPALEAMVKVILAGFYGACDVVLSPSPATDQTLVDIGIRQPRIRRWIRGVDLARFSPERRSEGLLPGEVNVVYAGRLSHEKGIGLLLDAFHMARDRDPRLRLTLAGGGPEEEYVRRRLGEHGAVLGWLGGAELARVYASADAFLFASCSDTYGQVIVEAQASGLPVVAVAEGGPLSLIEHEETGLLAGADPQDLARQLLRLTEEPLLRERVRRGGLLAARSRTWEAALAQLAEGYRAALRVTPAQRRRVA